MSKGYHSSELILAGSVNQVTVHSYAVIDVARHLGISDKAAVQLN